MRRLTTAHELEAILTPSWVLRMKELDALDEGCRRVLAHAPVAGFGFRDDEGVPHTTVVGGRRGFVRVDSPTRIAFALPPALPPPRAGGGVSFVFLLPGVGETLRLNGSVVERAEGVVVERAEGVVVVAVEEAFVHCAQCILRSGLWRAVRARRVESSRQSDDESAGPLRAPAVAGFLASAPFAIVSSWDAAGSSDTSPRGDEPGFLRVLDGETIAIPDRKGNNRTDTFHNLLSCPQVSVAAVVPGREDLLHLRGTAYVTDDPALLSTMALGGKPPRLALIVRVEHAEVIANEAVQASKLWRSSPRIEDVPDLMGVAAQHVAQNKARGVKAAMLRLLGRIFGAFPSFIRRLIDFSYHRGLTAEGYALPATTEAEPRSGLGARPVRVVEVVRETADAVTLQLEALAGAPLLFKAGQYFTLFVESEGESLRRAYSASSMPGEARLALTIKRVPGGRCSTYVNEKVRAGDRLELIGPSGSFCVEVDSSARRELVLLAGGSGITPLMSIARAVLANEPHSRVALLYGNRSESDVIFADALVRLRREHGDRFVLRHVLERPPAGWSGGIGRLDEATLREELTRLAPSPHAHFYVCGPEPMLRGARSTLLGLGVARDRIHEERFSQPRRHLLPKRDVDRRLPMVVERRGERIGAVDVPAGKTLLEAGLDAGLPMPFSCAMGNCGECRVRLTRGEVEMDDPNTLTPEERAQGFILACISRPLSPSTIEIEATEGT